MKYLLIASLLLAATDGRGAEDPAADHAGEPLVVDAASRKSLGIATGRVTLQALSHELRAPGEVKANAYATAIVSPRVPAQIVRRSAKLGDTVAAGQPLVTLSSIEVAEAQGALILAERDWSRVRQLGAEAVSARRYTESQVARDQLRAKLRAFGVTEGEIAALLRDGSKRANGEFALAAPQSGRITTDDFIVGERVEPGRVLFTLVDESRVWIEAQLAPDAAANVARGMPARVVSHAKTLSGTVVQLSHRTTESSRRAPVRIEVANDGDALHAGELVETFIATAGMTPSLSVPSAAIVQLQGQPTVFRAGSDDRFEAVPVEIGETRGDRVVVLRGLADGDVVVEEGAYVLKARLLKAQLGEGHAD
jgi:membrane fusion protein, heavy metal efflux system